MIKHLIEWAAKGLGVETFTVGVIVGLSVAAAPAIWGGYRIGHYVGWNDGYAAADKQAEINDLTRKLAEKERDRLAAEQSASAAREQAQQNARAMLSAQEDLDAYRSELEQLALANNSADPDEEPASAPTVPDVAPAACWRIGSGDLARLRRNHWRTVDPANGTQPAGRR